MKVVPEKTGNGAVEEPNLGQLLQSRQALLARLGETYLELEVHQASAQECVSRIQQLRVFLQRTEHELQTFDPRKGE